GICKEDDVKDVSFAGYYKKGASGEETDKDVPTPEFVKDESNAYVTEGGKYKLKIILPKVGAGDDYIYMLKPATTSSKNYYLQSEDSNKYEKAFSTSNKSLDLEDKDIVWQYKNYLLTGNDFKTIEAGEYITVETSGDDKIFNVMYNEYAFSFDVDKTSDTSKLKAYASDVDFDITIEGNPTNDKTVTNVKLNGNDVTYYTVKLKITAKTGKTVDIKKSEFTLKWKVNKAKFILSDVKWDYDAKTPREYNGGKKLEVKLTGLPAAILPDYYDNDEGEESNVKTKVCEIDGDGNYKPYTAKVVFKFNDKLGNISDIKNNYILPNKDDSSSYICREKNEDGEWTNKNFPWELEWIIKKAELDLTTDWEKVAKEDKNNVVFRPFEISDKTKAEKIVYEYYKENEWDNTNYVVIGNATPKKLEDIVVDFDSEPEKYWVVAKVNASNSANYEIKKGTEAKKFTVGAGVV
ncbi:MAG: hypothetical protein K2K24_01920, partial [Clostridia bacterium]|nr:hypothetical protein [Clostridia bacterium]